nr:MAG TPA: hypothetical protein [Caudoviricetes sp.]DAX39995.1 MAG TPA: hypothetical protein [Caudoviricetes sp.]
MTGRTVFNKITNPRGGDLVSTGAMRYLDACRGVSSSLNRLQKYKRQR